MQGRGLHIAAVIVFFLPACLPACTCDLNHRCRVERSLSQELSRAPTVCIVADPVRPITSCLRPRDSASVCKTRSPLNSRAEWFWQT